MTNPRRASILLVLLLAAPPRASATGHLHLMAGDQDVLVYGEPAWGGLGSPLVVADLDGDGRDDLVAGSPGYGITRGAVYAVAGRDSWPGTVHATATFMTRIAGADGNDGVEGASVGDFDGDGLLDLAVNARRAEGPLENRPWAGELGLFFGASRVDGAAVNTDQADVRIFGISGYSMYVPLTGDVNGDGLTDLVFSEGQGILFGRNPWPATYDLVATPHDVRLIHGALVNGVGDVNGDAIADLILRDTHAVRIVLGRPAWPPTLDFDVTPADVTFPCELCGCHVADVDGDGVMDVLIVHASDGGTFGYRGGTALGSEPPFLTLTSRLTYAVGIEAVGDFNGDAVTDIVRLAPYPAGRGRLPRGADVEVRLGPFPAVLDLDATPPDLVVHAADTIRHVRAGDLDGDGIDDLAITAARAGSSYEGAIYLVLGADFQARRPASDMFVDAGAGDDARDGLSWPTAKRTIDAALDALDATDGPVTVRVAAGVYAEPVLLGGSTELIGGFVAGSLERDLDAGRSIITLGGVVGAAPVVTIQAGALMPSLLDGFLVTGGFASEGPDAAGILVRGGASALVRDCIVSGNRSLQYWQEAGTCFFPQGEILCSLNCRAGATAVLVEWGSLELLNCLVYGNSYSTDDSSCGSNCRADGCFSGEHPFSTSATVRAGPACRSLRIVSSTIASNPCMGATCLGDAWADRGAEELVVENSIVGSVDGSGLAPVVVSSVIIGAEDPLFIGPLSQADGYRLSQVAAGEAVQSGAVDRGSRPAASRCLLERCLSDLTTRGDGIPDDGIADAGFHFEVSAGAPLPPGEPLILRVSKVPSGLEVTIRPGVRAEWHRVHRAPLAALRSGYAHLAGIGDDRASDTADDVGRCSFTGTTIVDGSVATGADVYFLASAWNAAGESHHGTDSFGRHGADATTGIIDCP